MCRRIRGKQVLRVKILKYFKEIFIMKNQKTLKQTNDVRPNLLNPHFNINPCPDCGLTPKLVYSKNRKRVRLVQPKPCGTYDYNWGVIADVSSTDLEELKNVIRDWNYNSLSTGWSEEACRMAQVFDYPHIVVNLDDFGIVFRCASESELNEFEEIYKQHNSNYMPMYAEIY